MDPNVFCFCGSRCICQDGCFCSPERNCICSVCKRLKIEAVCVKCGQGGENLTPIDKWPVTGRPRRELEPLYNQLPESCRRRAEERVASQDSSSPEDSETDDGLMFQMDDIHDPPDNSASKPGSSKIGGLSRTFQPSPNITLSNPRQFLISEDTYVLQSKESKIETSHVNPRTVSVPDESQITETPSTRNPSISSELSPNKIRSNPKEVQVTENASSEESSSNDSSDSSSDLSSNSHSLVLKLPPQAKSAPPRMVSELSSDLESRYEELSYIPILSDESTASNLSGIETLAISDSQPKDEQAQSELSSLSVETPSIDTNMESNANDPPQLYFSVIPSALTVTQTAVKSLISCPEQSLEIPSPECSEADNTVASSESSSSIETLSTEPSNENYKDEPPKNNSPKQDN